MQMNKDVTLKDIRAFLQAQEAKKKDLYVDLGDINLTSHQRVEILGREKYPDGTYGNGEHFELDIADHAMSQFYGVLGIPSGYAKKVPFELIEPHIEHWKGELDKDKRFLFRTYADEGRMSVRAVLSKRYGIIDNLDVLSAIEDGLDVHHLTIKGFSMDHFGDMMNLRLVDNRYQEIGVDPRGGSNPYFGGVHLVNGETGRFPVSLSALIWEQWCDNGAIRERFGNSLMKRRHIGDAEVLVAAFQEAALKAPEAYELSMNSFKEAQEKKVDHPYLVLNNLMKKERKVFSTDEFKLGVIDSFESRSEKTRYGIASAITEAAQKLPNYERRLQAEKLAGDILFFDHGLSTSGDEDEAKESFMKIRARVEAEDADYTLAGEEGAIHA